MKSVKQIQAKKNGPIGLCLSDGQIIQTSPTIVGGLESVRSISVL
jgi:hypothetical protein